VNRDVQQKAFYTFSSAPKAATKGGSLTEIFPTQTLNASEDLRPLYGGQPTVKEREHLLRKTNNVRSERSK
jgi:hypothetical protein